MKIAFDIPPDIERALLRKCEELGVSPSEFVIQLLEWYFFKRKRDIPKEAVEFLNFARKKGVERAKKCRYSDGKYCVLETYSRLDIDSEPQPLHPYECLFCNYFSDRDKEERRGKKVFEDAEEVYSVAKLAAKILAKELEQKIYRPKMKVEKEEIDKDDIRKLIENW
ncbi:hypothetical protein [Geoglobus acetivorans]|uniref:Uncharacterized protein n=1 Tax=Geoglobus acetivorans TaxID=565033 RepID=A0A0A7GFL7_GEOAI|nr:hypothetical protein GACE_1822 [Geoglobus acetivorans]